MEENHDKKLHFDAVIAAAAAAVASPGGSSSEDGFPLPSSLILDEILSKLNLESLCSLSSVCRAFNSTVAQALSVLPSVDLSGFSVDGELLRRIVARMGGVKSVSIDCLHLGDGVLASVLNPNILELNLLKCALLSYDFIPSIGEKCPNLRKLTLELAGQCSPNIFKIKLLKMLERFTNLEYLSIKIRGTESDAYDLSLVDIFLPNALNFLKLQPVNEKDVVPLIQKLSCACDDEDIPGKSIISSIPSHLPLKGFRLQSLSLVLDLISDRLTCAIVTSLNLLVELDLEDRACSEPKLPHDLTNTGLMVLGSCPHLTSISIVRSRMNYPVSFKRVNDLGVMILADTCCGRLESVKLGGFSKVTSAGFSSLFSSCQNLKKFEVRNAPLLTDLAFHDIIGNLRSLLELKLSSCNLITSEAVAQLAASDTLQVLDTNGCRSIADSCLDYISHVHTLTSLNLGGADITDSGLAILSGANLPISNLSLRGCTRVTDWGIISLFKGGDRIRKTLSSLDVGHMPGMSDRAVEAIVLNAESITELCMRYCFHVTDASFKMLASGRSDIRHTLQKFDICQCSRLSVGLVELLQSPPFQGLRWLGVFGTSSMKRDDFAMICRMRPWLTVCFEGCEMGCHDGWQFHKDSDRN